MNVIDGNGYAGRGGIVESQVFHTIQNLSSLLVGEGSVEVGGQVFQGCPVHEDVLEPNLSRQYFVEDHPAQSGLHPFAVVIAQFPYVDRSMQVNQVRGMSDTGLVKVVEPVAGAGAAFPDLRQVVATHHHVQCGRNQRLSGGRRQHIVSAEHDLFSF